MEDNKARKELNSRNEFRKQGKSILLSNTGEDLCVNWERKTFFPGLKMARSSESS